MPEKLDLTIPDGAVPGTTNYRVARLGLDFENGSISVDVVGDNLAHKSFQFDNVMPVVAAINTANLTTKSLQRRLLEKLIADGKLTGTISGVP